MNGAECTGETEANGIKRIPKFHLNRKKTPQEFGGYPKEVAPGVRSILSFVSLALNWQESGNGCIERERIECVDFCRCREFRFHDFMHQIPIVMFF